MVQCAPERRSCASWICVSSSSISSVESCQQSTFRCGVKSSMGRHCMEAIESTENCDRVEPKAHCNYSIIASKNGPIWIKHVDGLLMMNAYSIASSGWVNATCWTLTSCFLDFNDTMRMYTWVTCSYTSTADSQDTMTIAVNPSVFVVLCQNPNTGQTWLVLVK